MPQSKPSSTHKSSASNSKSNFVVYLLHFLNI